MLFGLLALLPALITPAHAAACVAFDASWNLYAFGGSQDVGLGASSSWGAPAVKPLTTSGRPPWTGTSSSCHLSQYNNALYVLGADSSDLSKVYIYDFAANTWSTQATSSAPSSLGGRASSVLDHDTNVFFTLPGNGAGLSQLDMGTIKATAQSSSVAWQGVSDPSFSTSGYTPVAALASNHISYFGAPGTPAGSTNIFIIHFSQFQIAPQRFPVSSNNASFPSNAAFAATIPDAQNNAGTQMFYVPADSSNAYVVTHWTNPGDYTSTSGAPFSVSMINTTQTFPAPSVLDTASYYAASPSDVVQITSGGDIYYAAGAISNYMVSSSAKWTKMSYSLTGVSGGSSSSNSSSSSSASASGSATSSGASASGSGSARASSTSGGSAASSVSSGAAAATSSRSSGINTAGVMRLELVGAGLGMVALGMALVL